MIVALAAASCMLITDILYTAMTMAQASGRGWLAGWLDASAWYVGITTTTISVTTLGGHGSILSARKLEVLLLVGAANVLGTQLGEVSGKRLLKHMHVETVETLVARVAALEAKVQ